MTSKHDDATTDLTKPSLILVHGTTARCNRLLDQDALLIGRARGCDLGLDAPDISHAHCVISRQPDGFRIRDLGSRAGTRVNGNKIREERLTDGDLLQIGPFSFRVHLPGAAPARPAADERLIQRLQRSRKNLVRQALRLRQALRQRPAAAPANGVPPVAIRQQLSGLRAGCATTSSGYGCWRKASAT